MFVNCKTGTLWFIWDRESIAWVDHQCSVLVYMQAVLVHQQIMELSTVPVVP